MGIFVRQSGINLPRTVEEIKHGLRRRSVCNQPTIPTQPTNRGLPGLPCNRTPVVPISSRGSERLRSLPALSGNRQTYSRGSEGYGYSPDGTPVNAYPTSPGGASSGTNPAILLALGAATFVPRKRAKPKLARSELRKSPSGVLWGLSFPGDPADPLAVERPGPPWNPRPWKLAGVGRYVDAETGEELDYESILWACQQVKDERIKWAFSRGRHDYTKLKKNKERFASLPPQYRLLAWAKFSALWEASVARGQSLSIHRALCFARAAKFVKYHYILGINMKKYGRLTRAIRRYIRSMVMRNSMLARQPLALPASSAPVPSQPVQPAMKSPSRVNYSGLTGI